MSIQFYCSTHMMTGIAPTPTPEEIVRFGGNYTVQTKTFHLNNGQQAKSPSGACNLCLQRRDGVTNDWRGPYHLAMEIDGRWIPYAATPFYNRPTRIRIA